MLFTLGSNTKTYTSSVVLKLHELKLLNLSDTIGKWFANNPNINGKITITQLLNHTSGVASYTENAAFWELVNADLTKKWTPEEIVPYIPAPSFALGTRWEYSNSNFLLAGLIIKSYSPSCSSINPKNPDSDKDRLYNCLAHQPEQSFPINRDKHSNLLRILSLRIRKEVREDTHPVEEGRTSLLK
jgi:hypothetical protein